MTVYQVFEHIPYEGSFSQALFSNEKAAEAYAADVAMTEGLLYLGYTRPTARTGRAVFIERVEVLDSFGDNQ